MTPQVPNNPNPPGQQPGGDGGQQQQGGGPPQRGRRRALRKKKAEELANWRFFDENPPGEATEVVLSGPRIGTDAGDVEVIGTMLKRLGGFMKALGGDPYMEDFRFANSAHVLIRADREEVKRAESELARAKELEGEKSDAEAPEEREKQVETALREAVTDVQVSLALAAELLDVSPDEAPRRAVELGGGVTDAFRILASASAANEVSVALSSPGEARTIHFTAAKADRVAEAIRTVTQPREYRVTVYGTLSMADALHNGFALRLDPAGDRPEVLQRKRVVSGTYPPRMEDVIRDQNLWGRSVRATILVREDALVSTSKIRPPTFTLIEAEARPE